jgi:hypothetical protein
MLIFPCRLYGGGFCAYTPLILFKGMDLPVFKLKIDPNLTNESEVDFVALVDMPAIEKDFMAFNKQPLKFSVNEERRIISGPLMLADKLIYRENDTMGQHYVVFDKDTIQQIAIKYAKKKYLSNVNEMHDPNKPLQGVTLFESFIVDKERGIQPMKGYEDSADGSWFGSMFVENDQAWADVKSGKFKGFSVEGMFIYDDQPSVEKVLQSIQRLLQSVPD